MNPRFCVKALMTEVTEPTTERFGLYEVLIMLLQMGGLVSFFCAFALMTCCCQLRSPDGEVLVLGKCSTDNDNLKDTCEYVLDPEHVTKTQVMADESDDPDHTMISAERE